MICLI